MKKLIKIAGIACALLLMSCNNNGSLQRYFVDHQEDADFVAVDLATSLLDTDKVQFTPEQKEALKSIKKVNFLALPIKESNKSRFTEEKTAINMILNSEKYETLLRFGSNGTKAVLKFQGDEEDHIDEMIVFASNQERGLALVRVLGDDMKPENIAQLMDAIDKGDIDTDVFKNILGEIDID